MPRLGRIEQYLFPWHGYGVPWSGLLELEVVRDINDKLTK